MTTEKKLAEPICDYVCGKDRDRPCPLYATERCHLDRHIKQQVTLIAEETAPLVEALKEVRNYVEEKTDSLSETESTIAKRDLAKIDKATG